MTPDERTKRDAAQTKPKFCGATRTEEPYVKNIKGEYDRYIVEAVPNGALCSTRPFGFGQATSWVAKRYAENFTTHVEVNYVARIERLIRRMCHLFEEEKGLWWQLSRAVLHPHSAQRRCDPLRRITNLPVLEVVRSLHSLVSSRLAPHRTKAGVDVLYMPFSAKLEALALVQRLNQRWGFRNFSLAPVCQVKRHFATIDKAVFREFIFPRQKAAGLFSESCTCDGLEDELMWCMLPAVDKLRPEWITEATFLTDGASLCVPFTKNVAVGVEADGTDAEGLQRGKVCVGIDPGGVNILTASWYDGHGTPKIMKLHRSRYLAESRIAEHRSKIARWRASLADVEQLLASNSSKTPDKAAFMRYATAVMDSYDAVWAVMGQHRVASSGLDVYAGKAACLDRFMMELKAACGARRRGRSMELAFGSAKFSTNRPGCIATPTTTAFKRARLRADRTVLVDEFRTTAFSAFSFRRMRDMKDGTGAVMRGFKCCGHSTDLELCGLGRHMSGATVRRMLDGTEVVVMSRDGNAALNLRNILARGTRPRSLRRRPD